MNEHIYQKVFFKDKIIDFKNANLSIASAPVLYGLSIYTVIPIFWHKKDKGIYTFRTTEHFKRLQNSAGILGLSGFLKNWDESRFSVTLHNVLKANKITEDCLVRILVFADEVLSGTKTLGAPHEVAMFAYTRKHSLSSTSSKIMVSSWRRTPDNAIPARAKVSGSYVNAALMKNEALSRGFDDAIALDDQGHVTESTVSNIFIIRDGILITPSASQDILEGITRDTIFSLAKDNAINYQERTVDRTELYLADEIFLSGSSNSIAPITCVDHRQIGNGKLGPITKKLAGAYEQIAHGELPDKHNWLTKV